MTNKKLFFIGLFWIALFFGIFVIGFVKVSSTSGYYKTFIDSWSSSWCRAQNYPCDNTFTNVILILWLLPSIIFLYTMPHLRRKVFLVGIIAMVVLVVLSFFDGHGSSICHDDICRDVISILLPFITIIPLSIILILFREEVFRTWLRFTYWWMAASLFLMLGASGQRGGGGFGMHSFGGEDFAMILSVLFFLVSLVIIVIRSLVLRGK